MSRFITRLMTCAAWTDDDDDDDKVMSDGYCVGKAGWSGHQRPAISPFTCSASKEGQVYATPPKGSSVGFPGRTELTFGQVLRTGLQSIVCRFGLAAFQRFDRNQRLVNETHKRHAPEHHW